MRYLNAHPDSVPLLSKRLLEYSSGVMRGGGFGLWVRNKHHADFDKAYVHWWLHRPRFFGKIYEE